MDRIPVKIIIKRFGRQADLAEKLGIGQPAVSEWVRSGRIPPERHADLLELARQEGVELTLADLNPELARAAEPPSRAAS